MRFESPLVLLVLLVLPLMFWLRYRKRQPGTLSFSSIATAARIGPSLRQRLTVIPPVLRVFVLILLTVALARPQEGKEQIKDISQGIAIEMVVDRSGSMGQDMEYEGVVSNRLGVVKAVFEKFVTGGGRGLPGRPADLIGMVAFARYPDTVCPLTLSHGALHEFLGTVRLAETRNEDGTAIGEAIALAAARLKMAEETIAQQTGERSDKYRIKSKIIILLTDGENNAGKRNPLQAAKLAAGWGIKIYTIGVGGGEGTMMVQDPFFGSFRVPGRSGVNTAMLKQIADETGGIFRMAEDAKALHTIYQEIDRLERTDVESVRYMDYREMAVPFALAGLILLCLEIVLRCTVFRRAP
ncbi:MAG: VWA domain-containing protein [bacterium]